MPYEETRDERRNCDWILMLTSPTERCTPKDIVHVRETSLLFVRSLSKQNKSETSAGNEHSNVGKVETFS
jgi:hypothetical protein